MLLKKHSKRVWHNRTRIGHAQRKTNFAGHLGQPWLWLRLHLGIQGYKQDALGSYVGCAQVEFGLHFTFFRKSVKQPLRSRRTALGRCRSETSESAHGRRHAALPAPKPAAAASAPQMLCQPERVPGWIPLNMGSEWRQPRKGQCLRSTRVWLDTFIAVR